MKTNRHEQLLVIKTATIYIQRKSMTPVRHGEFNLYYIYMFNSYYISTVNVRTYVY